MYRDVENKYSVFYIPFSKQELMKMKFVHLADLHIGKRVNGFSMIEDQKYILSQIADIIKSENPDAIIIAGDVYDKSVPTAEAVCLLDSFFTSLCSLCTHIFVISGNHDSSERLAFCSGALKNSGLYISPVFDGKVMSVDMTDEFGTVAVHLLPFVKPSVVRAVYEIEDSLTYTEAVSEVVSRMEVDETKRNVLVAHQFVTGSARSESEEVSVGGLDDVDAAVFAPFDYTALGHIHRPQQHGANIRYSGSPLKYSFSEAAYDKSVTVVTLGAKGDVAVDTVPLVPMHDMREIKGSYMQITDKSFYENFAADDYVHITLTDEDDIIDAVGKLRSIYPNIMKLDYDNERTRANAEITVDTELRSKTPSELFSELYKMQNNADMTEKQRNFLTELLENIRG